MHHTPFPTRGLVEGFYGLFYTAPERADLIRFLAAHGYNTYIYGPKNDRQHRARWWEPYPEQTLEQLGAAAALARDCGIDFCYALAPITATLDDLDRIMAKLVALYGRGVRSFSLFLDDIAPGEAGEAPLAAWGDAHARLVNAVYDRLRALDPACTLSMCPVEYHGSAPFGPYLLMLGERLHPAIDLFYTGPEVCSTRISAADARAFARVARRTPLLWDNYPVNDLDMRTDLHLGPLQGRDPELAGAVKGVLVNPMSQCEASKIALATYAEYLADPQRYLPWSAWERALDEVGRGSAAPLRRFAGAALASCLTPVAAPELAGLADAALAALRGGEPARQALCGLLEQVDRLDEDCYALKFRADNLRLRDNLAPWIEALEEQLWMVRRAATLLEALECGSPPEVPARALEESLDAIGRHHKRIAGDALTRVGRYALERAASSVSLSLEF
ncbi:MAG TPA: beta-N-acetylglucosaminidase domain-containing protein [Roseiflexaceae bacterium]|nr:beta-N-acetylglucosaminidase domain-containing protein [Roseiflexaceae bacterium]